MFMFPSIYMCHDLHGTWNKCQSSASTDLSSPFFFQELTLFKMTAFQFAYTPRSKYVLLSLSPNSLIRRGGVQIRA